MDQLSVISFDLEGTLVTHDYSQAIWYEGIPRLYADSRDMTFDEARTFVEAQYRKVGWQRAEWYDIRYWFERFGLGDHRPLLDEFRQRIAHYPEVAEVITSLNREYRLIIATGTSREFLPYMLDCFEGCFARVFSSISDFGELKSPAFFRTICQEMKVKPGEVIHVGDSWQFDIDAARGAGIEAFHIDRGAAEGDSLRSLAELKLRLSPSG